MTALPDMAETVIECVDALAGFVDVYKRSETLDGALMLHAAQGCVPVRKGNAAGYQLRLHEPALLLNGPDGPSVRFTDSAMELISREYAGKLAAVIDAGLLPRNGYWHRELGKGAITRTESGIRLWTGLLVRPLNDLWLLVTGAWNQRVPLDVTDRVLLGRDGFVPVILDIGVPCSSEPTELWLDAEIGCLTPLRPGVNISKARLDVDPEPVHSFLEFYAGRPQQRVTGHYRRLVNGESQEWVAPAQARLAVLGPDPHEIAQFTNFADTLGPAQRPADPLHYALIRNVGHMSALFDGRAYHDVTVDLADAVSDARETWRSLFGDAAVDRFDHLGEYFSYPPQPQHEPLFNILTWTFMTTPPGWSSIVDGFHDSTSEGQRGVLSTDAFHHVSAIRRAYAPARILLADRQPLLRIIPVPRACLALSLVASAL